MYNGQNSHTLLVRAAVWFQSLCEVKNYVLTRFPDSFEIKGSLEGLGKVSLLKSEASNSTAGSPGTRDEHVG